MAISPVPEGYHTITPYLIVEGAERLIRFLEQAFGGQELYRTSAPDGTIHHASLRVGSSMIEMADAGGPFVPTLCALHVYVPDTDATYARALRVGAVSTMEPRDEFYGDRAAGVKDEWGNHWFIATRQEELSPEELAKRVEAQSRG